MITDVTIDQLKKLSTAGSFLFRYETETSIELYYSNKGPIIFRSILNKDSENKWYSALQHFPSTILLLSPIRDNSIELLNEVKRLKSLVEGMERRRILR